MKELTLEDFRAELKAQGVERDDYAFKCPMCGTIQSARTLIAAGAGADFDAVQGKLGFSCVGRYSGAKGWPSESKEKNPGQGCNWSLGGLLQMHKLQVVTPDGQKHPHFEPATPAEAQALAATGREAQ